MYENGIRVTYRLMTDVPTDGGYTVQASEPRTVDLPGWCAGDVHMAVALYTHGNRDGLRDVLVDDWQVL